MVLDNICHCPWRWLFRFSLQVFSERLLLHAAGVKLFRSSSLALMANSKKTLNFVIPLYLFVYAKVRLMWYVTICLEKLKNLEMSEN